MPVYFKPEAPLTSNPHPHTKKPTLIPKTHTHKVILKNQSYINFHIEYLYVQTFISVE